MIIDNLKNAHQYGCLGEKFGKAFAFLMTTDFEHAQPGVYEIDSQDIFARLQSYLTKPDEACAWEAHQAYYDIQYVISGTERMGYVNLDQAESNSEYDAVNDIRFYQANGSYFTCPAGTFVVFGPDDVHRPCLADGIPSLVTKIVIKIRV